MGWFDGDKVNKRRRKTDYQEPVGKRFEPEPKRDKTPGLRNNPSHNKSHPVPKIELPSAGELAKENLELQDELESKEKQFIDCKNKNRECVDAYKKLKSELNEVIEKNKELNNVMNSVDDYNKKITELETNKGELGDSIKRLTGENERLKQELKSMRDKNQEFNAKDIIIQELKAELGNKDNKIQDFKNKLMSTDRIKEENVRIKADIQELKSHKIQDNGTICRLCDEDFKTSTKLIRHCRGKAGIDDAHRLLLNELEGKQSRTGEAEISEPLDESDT